MTLIPANRRLLLLSTALSLSFAPMLASALPTGGSVAQGSASISSAGTTTTINQSTSKAVINWTGFDTASGETVKFVDPNASSVTLNRISGPATSFSGTLQSNGSVWLLNPQGIAFNSTSQVNVGGLLATTSNITDSNFMAGNYNFVPGGGPAGAAVSNAGTITVAKSGLATLVGPNVSNSGTITANVSKITLASGDAYTVDLAGDGLINLQASNAMTAQALANTGTLTTGKKVVFTAAQANNVLDNVINLDGIVNANSLEASNQSGDLEYGAQFAQSTGGHATLSAYRNVTVGAGSQIAPVSGKLNVTLDSNDTGAAGGGSIYVAHADGVPDPVINSNGGDIVLGGGANARTGYAVGDAAPGTDSSGDPIYNNGIFIEGGELHAGGGNIVLNGEAMQTGSTAAVNSGINLGSFTTTVIMDTTGSGNITLNGIGSNDGITTSNGIFNSNAFLTTDAGTIKLTGKGGTAGDLSAGIESAGSYTSNSGAISLNGTGGDTLTGEQLSTGIDSFDTIQSGSGAISLKGTGGTGVNSDGIITQVSSSIISDTGNINITGKGGTLLSGGDGGGVFLSGFINSSGTGPDAGSVNINGIGPKGNGSSEGVVVNGGIITTADGNVSINGTGNGNSSVFSDGYGVDLSSAVITTGFPGGSGSITLKGNTFKDAPAARDIETDPLSFIPSMLTTASGDITFISNTLNFPFFGLMIQSGGNVSFVPRTRHTSIGVAGESGTLAITSDVLSDISANNITIGSTLDTGKMTIGAYSWSSSVTFLNGSGDIVLNGVNESTGSITLATLTGNFINNVGAGALLPDGGRFLIYTSDPSKVVLNGLATDFQQFGCTYGDTCSGLPPTGNGLVFSQLSE